MDNAILLGYQQRWIEDTSQVKIMEKSRRIGLSYAEAADAVLYAGSQKGANVYYISYDKEMTQGFIEDCAGWLKAFNLAAGAVEEEVLVTDENKQILIYEIKFDNGHKIKTFSSNPRKLRSKGKPGERLIIDEAAFVDNLDELLKSAMAMTVWGGSVHVISTHNGDESPYNTLIEDVRKGRYDFSLHQVTLDDALDDGFYRRICEVTSQTWSAEGEVKWRESLIKRYKPNEDEELFCIPALGGGTYLPRALIKSCVHDAPVVRFNGTKAFNLLPEPLRAEEVDDWIDEHLKPLLGLLDPECRHTFGMDFARSGDMSVIAPLEIGETLIKTVPFLVEMHNVPHKQQEQILFAVVKAIKRMAGGAVDAGGNGSYIAEAAEDEFGPTVEKLQFSSAWYRDNMPKYKAAFEDRTIYIPNSDDVIEDHRAIKIVRGVPKLPDAKTDKKGERHGDSAIAIALAHYASEQEFEEFAYEKVGQTEDRSSQFNNSTFNGNGRGLL